MKKTTVSATTITPDRKSRFFHHSDGSELIPSEIASQVESEQSLVSGYTIDDEGIINAYAIEPQMSAASYPTPTEKLYYFLESFAAIILMAALLGIALAVS